MAELKGLVYIGVEHIHPHPDNPRKQLGDLSELTESIKKNGVLQNLTLVPVENQPGEYTVIIGHRRHAAATAAGLTEVPCIIAEMSGKEQFSTMLEENMQRSDLTIYEQAEGFQMMLDLGETEDSIAEKTGFSKTTIRHRLNIAKLDSKELKKKEDDENFQMTLKDLYALEKVEDIETRNKILKEAKTSRDLQWKADSAVTEAKRKKNADTIIELLKKKGIEEAPEGTSNQMYSGKWDRVETYELDKTPPKRVSFKEAEPMFYLRYYRELVVIKKSKKKAKELSEADLQKKELDKRKKEIAAKGKEMGAVRKEFIQSIISGKIDKLKDTSELQKLLWHVMLYGESYITMNNLISFFLDKEYYQASADEREEAEKKVEELTVIQQMLISMPEATKRIELTEYNGTFRKKSGKTLKVLYEALGLYGYVLTDEERSLIEGTHELYTPEKVEEKAGEENTGGDE